MLVVYFLLFNSYLIVVFLNLKFSKQTSDFEIILCYRTVAKIAWSSQILFSQFPLLLIAYVIMIHLSNLRTNICTLLWTMLWTFLDFFSFPINVLFLFHESMQDIILHFVVMSPLSALASDRFNSTFKISGGWRDF